MRNSVRFIAILLCLILVGTCVFATEPGDSASQTAVETTAEPVDPESLWEIDPPVTEPVVTEPVVTEPPVTEPPVTEPPVTEPPVTEPPVTEPPVPPEPPVSEMTDAQIIAKFKIRNNWARNALIFAVRNGILAGKGGDNLAPKDNTTHAQLATMLTSILKTKKTADMSQFTDVKPTSWYYTRMSRAVSLGIYPISDPNATRLYPNYYITREEAFVAIARTFGVHGNGKQSIYQFADWADVSSWAASDVSAMIDSDCIGGINGKIMPQKRITRQELAQVLYRLLTKVDTEMPASPFTGKLALASSTVPKNTVINGDLLLSTDATPLRLEGLTVTGKLIIQGNDLVYIRLKNCNINQLILCRPAEISANNPIPYISCTSLLKLSANAKTVDVPDRLLLREGFTVDTVNAMAESKLTIDGTVKTLNVLGKNVYINGKGQIQKLVQHGEKLRNYCTTANTVVDLYNSVQTVTGVRLDSNNVATESAHNLKLRLKLTKMPAGWSECDLVWYVNGKLHAQETRQLYKENSEISTVYDFNSFLDGSYDQVYFTVYMTIDGVESLIYKGSVKMDPPVRRLAESIRTQNVQATLRNTGTLYDSMELSTVTRTNIPAGTQVTVLQSRESTATKIRLSDGTVGWTRYSNVQIINNQYYITTDYTKAVKEYYVNTIREATSSTNYLIWISLYTQRINVFQGSKGKWKLIRTGPIASGRNDCPTPVEVVNIRRKTTWFYPRYYCHHVSVFDEARGMHSRPTRYDEDGGGIYSPAIGYPASAGCVRLLDEDCIFIYDNCPVGTAVYIY